MPGSLSNSSKDSQMIVEDKIHLYAITDEYLTPDNTVLEQVKESLDAGISILQYRNKSKTDEQVRNICIELQRLCKTYNVPFIIDDRPFLAQSIGADGLHIGKDDMSLSEARKIFTQGIIGVSCYGSLRKAKEAEKEGADYVAFGSFFKSPTKPHSGIISRSIIKKAKNTLQIPVCVIGGICSSNIDEMIKEKPDMISVVNGIYDGNITNNIKELLAKMS